MVQEVAAAVLAVAHAETVDKAALVSSGMFLMAPAAEEAAVAGPPMIATEQDMAATLVCMAEVAVVVM